MPESDDDLLDRFQRAAFGYFLEHHNPDNGLIADTSRPGAPASIAVAGFALSCYPVAVERGWMSRDVAAGRVLATLGFFWNSRQGEDADATGHKGLYYHFLDLRTGRRVWRSELSVMDTALLLAGMLCAASYFAAETAAEAEIRRLVPDIYARIDWPWARGSHATIRHGWKPETGFLRFGWEGYDEAAILHVLAMASPTHPLGADSYYGRIAGYRWKKIHGYEYLYAGPLFIHQFSHAWIDFAGIRDAFMREKGSDYFENSRRAVAVHQKYAHRNPGGFKGYGEDAWGLSACHGPGPGTIEARGRRRRLWAYAARGAPFGPDDGTLSPAASLACLPFAPGPALAALRRLCELYPAMIRQSRLPGAFNPSLPGDGPEGWVLEVRSGLDQGLLVMMIENFRSGLIWRLMRGCTPIGDGLRRAGFMGGWL